MQGYKDICDNIISTEKQPMRVLDLLGTIKKILEP
jgi:hypothetical protein